MQLRSSLDGQVSGMAADINGLTSQIAQLNTQIASVTDGGTSPSTANGMTDQRNQAIASLSQLIGIQVNTQPDGTVSIYDGGENLVDEGTAQQVAVTQTTQSRDYGLHAPGGR